MFCQDSSSFSKHMPTESVPCLGTFNTHTHTQSLTSTLPLNLSHFKADQRVTPSYLQPPSCRTLQNETSGSFCRDVAACPSDLTPTINRVLPIRRYRCVCRHISPNFWDSDLEVLLHGFSNMRGIVRRSDQFVFAVEHCLHSQVSYPEGWEDGQIAQSDL